MTRVTVLVTLSLAAVLLGGECARRNGTVKLEVQERYRRLIPYMTFYLHQDNAANPNYKQTDSNNQEQSRYQGFNQGYNHGFVSNNPQRGYVPYQLPATNSYFLQNNQGQGQSFVKAVAQNYVPVKNNRVPERAQYVQTQQQPRLPQPPKFLSGFKPMDPNAITVSQSQELSLQQSTQRPYDNNNSPRPFILDAEHNSLRPFLEQESQRPYVEQESQRQPVEQDSQRPYVERESQRPYLEQEVRRPYVEQELQRPFPVQESRRPYGPIENEPQRTYVTPAAESPRPFIVTVEPNSQPRLPQTDQSSQRPFVQYVTTTLKPQYYTPVSNHIYPTPSADYQYEDDRVLNGYDISRVLPSKITSDNLESSIKTLSRLLQILQKANALPQSAKKLTKVKVVQPTVVKYPLKVKPSKQQHAEDFDDEGSTPGKAGVDYPAYTKIPQTSFDCKDQRYKGFFGDPETNCQVWHYCDLNGGQASFLCPNGTIFSQVALTCDWWFNVKCASTAQLYVLNERLYKYIIPQKPSFPEDYSGPVVDRYLEQKYRELEEKRKNKNSTQTDDSDEDSDDDAPAHETNQARAINY